MYLLGAHAAGDFSRVTLDASNDRVGVGTFLGSLVELLDNNDLLACLAALQDDGNLERGTHHTREFTPRPSRKDKKTLLFLACRLNFGSVHVAVGLGERERTFGHLDVGAGGELGKLALGLRLSKPPGNLREYCTVVPKKILWLSRVAVHAWDPRPSHGILYRR